MVIFHSLLFYSVGFGASLQKLHGPTQRSSGTRPEAGEPLNLTLDGYEQRADQEVTVKKFRYIWLLPLTLLLMSCATNYATKSAAEVGAALETHTSEFDSLVGFRGPPVFSSTRRGLFVDNETTRLAAAKDKKSGKSVVLIEFSIIYPMSWRFYNSVSFQDSTKIEPTEVARSADACGGMGCVFKESFAVPVEVSKLEAPGEFKFRVNSKKGVENVITLQRSYIDGFLQSLRAKGLAI